MNNFLLLVFLQILLPPLWMLIFYEWIDARWSGWKNLAMLYRATEVPKGRKFENATLCLNARRYRGIATVVVGSHGLYIRLIPAFFILHPPLVVPRRNMKALCAGSTMEFELSSAKSPVMLRLTDPALHEAVRQFELNSPPQWRLIPRRKVG